MIINYSEDKPNVARIGDGKKVEEKIFTEKGPFSVKEIERAFLQTDSDEFFDCFMSRMKRKNLAPTMRETMYQIICKKYYPGLLCHLVVVKDRQNWEDFIISEIVEPIRQHVYAKAKANNRSKEAMTYAYWYSCVGATFGSPHYVKLDDGRVMHLFDQRIDRKPDPDNPKDKPEKHQEPLNTYVKADPVHAIEMALVGIDMVFKSKKEIGSKESMIGIIDWYISASKMTSDRPSMIRLARKLKAWSREDDQTIKDVTIGVFEDNQRALDDVYRSHPELDFVDRGRYEEFASVDLFAKAVGLELSSEHEEFFTEPSEREPDEFSSGGNSGGAKGETEKDPDYGAKILTSIDKFCSLVAPLASSVKVFNIKPNEVKKRKADVFGKYVAVAAKVGDIWWILVDAVKPGNAIYLWHDKSYLDGLETFKQSKAYAREQKSVDHMNHSSKRKTIDIYCEICKRNGLTLG